MASSKHRNITKRELGTNDRDRSDRGRGRTELTNDIDKFADIYVENVASSNSQLELEVRFGTLGFRTLTHTDHSNVIDRILAAGYRPIGTGDYHLRIHYENESVDDATDSRIKHEMSNNRFEIDGLSQIQKYCTTNQLDSDVSYGSNRVRCVRKMNAYINGAPVRPAQFSEFNFKVSLQRETVMRLESAEIARTIQKWPQTKKAFRYMKRISFEHPDSPIRFDLSIVKESKRMPPPNSWKMMTTYTFDQANVIESPPKYEIEIEIDNRRIGPGKRVNNSKELAFLLRKGIKVVLSGLQGTNFPVQYSELQTVANDYHHLLYRTHDKRQRRYNDSAQRGGADDSDFEKESSHTDSDSASDTDKGKLNDRTVKNNVRLKPSDFIGPSSVTLQRANVVNKYDITTYNRATSVPNIRHNYTVTDKADGQRKLLFVSGSGKIYLIDTAMNIQFTGMICRDEKLYWSLLDGEHILHSKTGEYINMYAAFDIYFIGKTDTRHLAFAFQRNDSANTNTTNFRLYYLSVFMTDPKNAFQSIVSRPGDESASLRIISKRFRVAAKYEPGDIFSCCSDILRQINDGGFIYNTDGLIFTPADTGVCMFGVGQMPKNKKCTWDLSFKWKPSMHNTIDFLVTTDKNEDQTDLIRQRPNSITCSDTPIIKYKTLTLRVKYSREHDGITNPLRTVLDGIAKHNAKLRMLPEYPTDIAAVAFYPTLPYDASAHICNIPLRNVNGVYQMCTETGDVFTDKSVVEFRYDKTREPGMRWIPIKVRHDKTLARECGNAFHVANSNWHSLHYPVEEHMLRSDVTHAMASNDTTEEYETDVYYQRKPDAFKTKTINASNGVLVDVSPTKPLRDFHNKFVKRALISSVATSGKTLIDFACGKGGDISKWIDCELKFVFGIDISEDNISNNCDGAYTRYLNYARFHTDSKVKVKDGGDEENAQTYMVFAKADSSKVIRELPQNALDSQENPKLESEKTENSIYHAIKQTVFGERTHDSKFIGEEFSKYFGIGREGFDVSSVQFALHYFWKDVKTLHTFMRNVSECTKVGGYFIGTCYDGRSVFNLLKKTPNGDTIRFEDAKYNLIAGITKRYNKQEYFDDETCIGYAIDVITESINVIHTEYLVNMIYLERVMRNYGFELVSETETQRDLFLPSGYGASMGSFRQLFDMMTYYVKGMVPSSSYGYGDIESEIEASTISLPKRAFPENHPLRKFQKFMGATSGGPLLHFAGKANEMTPQMKAVSFMNNYFVFKKIQHVDAKVVSDAFIKNEGMVADALMKEDAYVSGVSGISGTAGTSGTSGNQLGNRVQQVAMALTVDKNKDGDGGKDKGTGNDKGSRVKKQVDGVPYVLDTETGNLYKSMTSNDPIGTLKVNGAAKRKTIEFISEEYRAKHELQKEKAMKTGEKIKNKILKTADS